MLATVERVEGEVNILASSGKTPVQASGELLEGQGIEAAGEKSGAILLYPDGTRVELGPQTEIRDMAARPAKRAMVARGAVKARVAKQPQGQPMVFVTPHGEARVLGTTLRIVVDPDPRKGTRLEVEEGKVQLKNLLGRTVDVPSGHFAVAATGLELSVKSLPIDEILLVARNAKIFGNDWHGVRDPAAADGVALEARAQPLDKVRARLDKGTLGYVEFAFQADPNRDYSAWIRGCCTATDARQGSDALLMVPRSAATFTGGADDRGVFGGFNGFSDRTGYWWVGGVADERSGHDTDIAPVVLRFAAAGPQTLRIYGIETPMRFDLIRLSTRQKTRPADAPQSTDPGRK
jgi:hypothetical protein